MARPSADRVPSSARTDSPKISGRKLRSPLTRRAERVPLCATRRRRPPGVVRATRLPVTPSVLAPSVRTAAFRAEVARALLPHGFKALAEDKTLRRAASRGVVESVQFSASHRNSPVTAVCWVALSVTDKAIERVTPGWRAGGELGAAAFGDEVSFDLAEPGRHEALLAHVLERTAFFELLRAPAALLEAASRGPVPGLLEPWRIAPYLHVRLGPDAVARYAEALLAGRPELWPAFMGAVAARPDGVAGTRLDDGSSLAVEAARLGPPGFARALAEAAPRGVAPSTHREAAHLRSHLGLQLRAWGEAEHTPRLAQLDDDAVRALFAAQRATQLPADAPELVALLLAALPGAPSSPRRAAPSPRWSQYAARAEPWGRPAFELP